MKTNTCGRLKREKVPKVRSARMDGGSLKRRSPANPQGLSFSPLGLFLRVMKGTSRLMKRRSAHGAQEGVLRVLSNISRPEKDEGFGQGSVHRGSKPLSSFKHHLEKKEDLSSTAIPLKKEEHASLFYSKDSSCLPYRKKKKGGEKHPPPFGSNKDSIKNIKTFIMDTSLNPKKGRKGRKRAMILKGPDSCETFVTPPFCFFGPGFPLFLFTGIYGQTK